MRKISDYITENYKEQWDMVTEMASIGYPILNKKEYLIALHGLNAGERNRPHIHIYLKGDVRPFSKFNFEIALDEIVCYDELNLIRMLDKSKKLDIKNRNKCSWNNYIKLHDDFIDWLFDTNVEKRGEFIDNLDAIIYFYNEESKSKVNNALLEYIKEHGMKIMKKYNKYFSEEDQEIYKECFERK